MTNTTDLQTVRDALVRNKNYLLTKHNMGRVKYAEERRECSKALTKALAALDRIEGMVLPELPEGVLIHSLQQYYETSRGMKRCRTVLYRPIGSDRTCWQGEGPTPRSAGLCAVKKIGGVG